MKLVSGALSIVAAAAAAGVHSSAPYVCPSLRSHTLAHSFERPQRCSGKMHLLTER